MTLKDLLKNVSRENNLYIRHIDLEDNLIYVRLENEDDNYYAIPLHLFLSELEQTNKICDNANYVKFSATFHIKLKKDKEELLSYDSDTMDRIQDEE